MIKVFMLNESGKTPTTRFANEILALVLEGNTETEACAVSGADYLKPEKLLSEMTEGDYIALIVPRDEKTSNIARFSYADAKEALKGEKDSSYKLLLEKVKKESQR